jgi:predicted nuclease of predicted toxin-antitoxin system
VRSLRGANYDVEAIMEIASGETDVNIIKMAINSGLILITEDRDVGDLVYAHQNNQGGIILIRYTSTARKNMAEAVRSLIQQRGEGLAGCFVVVSPLKVRIRTRV